MRAAYIDALCSADDIVVGELPTPEPGRGDVLVAVTATTVDPVDVFVRSGAYPTELSFPFVIGRDLVGTVAATGDDVDGFAVGDRVWCNSLGHAGRQGAAAEFVLVAPDRLFRLPDGVPDDAVTVLHPAASAYLALEVHGRVTGDDVVVIVGAAGNVGSAAVVIATYLGAHVIAVAHAADAEYCTQLGAERVLDADADDLAEQIADAGGADVWLDAAGVDDLGAALHGIRRRGRIVVMAGLRVQASFTAGDLYTKDASIVGFAISNAEPFELASAAETVNRLLVAGTLHSRRVETVPLDGIADVHRRLESGELRGTRVVVSTT
jgi:NADPH:quinone reductase-like Zn-dependent oxidoreductase